MDHSSMSDYMAHGFCFLWEPSLVWLHVISDIITGVAYYAIPISLLYLLFKRRDVPFLKMFILFGVFVFACGTTHFLAAYTIYVPAYWYEGVVKAITALVSITAAIVFIPLLPKAIAMPSLTKAMESLRDSEKRFRVLFEQAAVGVAQIDTATGRFIRINQKYCDIVGYTREEMERLDFQTITYPDDLQPDLENMERLRTGQVDEFTMEKRYLQKGGAIVWVSLTVSPMWVPGSAPDNYIVIVQDITERRRSEAERQTLEERLQRAEKMEALGILAGGVAHDLNNVLGVLMGYSEMLIEKIPAGDTLRIYIDNILKSTEKGASIVQELLTLARRGVTVSKVVNFNGVVSNFLMSPVFEKLQVYNHRVTFRADLDQNLLNIKGSPFHLEKTVMNLISNAAEAVLEGGEVVIRTKNCYLDRPIHGYDQISKGEYVALTVSDNGEGISATELDKIFEPFYTKKVMGRSGTGLGLAIVWGTVKDHHGYIDVQSEYGKGTTFTLYFPVTREEAGGDLQKIGLDQCRGRGESILVVDDVKEQREMAATMLIGLRYQVHTVAGGEEAVEYLKTNKVDLLMLDMIMDPGIDGLETYRRVLEINPRQKAILVSGFSETDRVKTAQALGAGAYVRKPYLQENIALAVRQELDRQHTAL